MDLIHRCINNDPQLRPSANEIVRLVSQIASQFPASFANRLDMLRQIEADRLESGEEGHQTEQSVVQELNRLREQAEDAIKLRDKLHRIQEDVS